MTGMFNIEKSLKNLSCFSSILAPSRKLIELQSRKLTTKPDSIKKNYKPSFIYSLVFSLQQHVQKIKKKP